MIRHLMIAAVAAALLPASAEAAKMRSGGSRPAPDKAAAAPASRPGVAAGVGAGVVVGSRVGRATQANGKPGEAEPTRVPFPPASTPAPVLLRLTTAEAPKAWCAGEKVVGGFCVMN